jgi:hypothetical protein
MIGVGEPQHRTERGKKNEVGRQERSPIGRKPEKKKEKGRVKEAKGGLVVTVPVGELADVTPSDVKF